MTAARMATLRGPSPVAVVLARLKHVIGGIHCGGGLGTHSAGPCIEQKEGLGSCMALNVAICQDS